MIQLAAVTCFSIAAKVEETQVRLICNLQVETKYVFEAKTIRRIELLVLSKLRWKMHPITLISFVESMVWRLGLKNNVHWDFFQRCERFFLFMVSDSRYVSYLPSVLATATVMCVVEQIEPFDPNLYQNQFLDVLKLSKEKVEACYKLILQLPVLQNNGQNEDLNRRKSKRCHESTPNNSSCVIDSKLFTSDRSEDIWSASSHNCYHQSSLCSHQNRH